ncbi:hypothetical protein D9619_013384 [Psilocybe cf. subviscida]|uniref:TRIP4/RQT4 C2HC5-type zinc finger domain-containing protein n=1 Tax=Psilocybe cf. subviscida TaxID=2480587 RepID=A0A8H5BTC1_9AGAR|nr:hypothetical protein D9619_013384 [Psilocybe cf. subviscida]
MNRTAWSKASSLPSDRIKPVAKGPAVTAKSKGKGKQHDSTEPSKSKEVKRLEKLLAHVKSVSGHEKDPNRGCFCLARSHELSPYTPICKSCGLILCSVNLPHHACPHCGSDLLSAPTVRDSLIDQIDTQLAETIAKEIAERERAIEEAHRAAGAFPTLSNAPPGGQSGFPPPPSAAHIAPQPVRQTHKVMSLTGGSNRKVMVSSYTSTPVTSRPASRAETVEPEPERVPPPHAEPLHAPGQPESRRPWENLLGESITYVPPSRLDDGAGGSKTPSRRNRNHDEGKGKG